MSKDSIERAVKKAIGGDAENYDEIRYEGYGPGGVAVIVEALTDKPQPRGVRYPILLHQIRRQSRRNGFGRLHVRPTPASSNTTPRSPPTMRCWMRRSRPAPTTYCRARTATRSTPRRTPFARVAKALEAKFGEARKAALTWKPQNTVPVDDETGEKLLKLIDLLNEHDDVQNVYANFEVSDALMTKMGG